MMQKEGGGISPADIKALLHFDGNFNDARGHTVTHNNTYNNTWIDGVFGQAASKGTGNLNIEINGLQTTKPTAFTAMWFGYNTSCNIGVCGKRAQTRVDNNCGLIITFNGGPSVWLNGSWNTRRSFTQLRTVSISGGWHHYALTYDNGYMCAYQDGEKFAEITVDPDTEISLLGASFYISSLPKNGAIDEFMYSDKLLIVGDTYDVPTAPFK